MRIRFQPAGVHADVEGQPTILQVAQHAGVEIESVCGGRGTCGKCRVIARGPLSPLTTSEEHALSPDEIAQGYRLACQALVLGDVDVVVPEESRRSRVSILSAGAVAELELDPWVHRIPLRLAQATLADQLPDLENVQRAAEAALGRRLKLSLNALQQLPHAIRQDSGQVTLIEVDDEVIMAHPGAGPSRLLGVAFDIGTTTIVGYLLDLETGEQLAVSSQLNPQTRYGDDVISRIAHAGTAQGLHELQQAVLGAVSEIIADTTGQVGATPNDVLAVVAVGNTTMHHLLLGIDPSALAQAPYVPVATPALRVRACELKLAIYPDAAFWLLPNIAGWVGADTVGVLLSSHLYEQDELGLAIDIGTNGEMALGSRERLVACSTAAGPAFEGAQISCGMRAADGAIDHVEIDHDVRWHAIGEVAPRGVCGSGLVDLVAQMLTAGILSRSGRMEASETLLAAGRPALARRIVGEGRSRQMLIVEPNDGAGGRGLSITQRDVRELQLAKGAIRAGIEILLSELGATAEDVRVVYLAGAFGNYIAPQSALTIGLIPAFPNARLEPLGNAAGTGARMALLSRAEREKATRLLAHVEYLELSGRPDFQQQFAEAMLF
ncbi:MAG: ASKHA domain-containing protein [Anaerolineales bacterium]